MSLTLTQSISALTVFVQGLLSFFSPCVLPLLPVYLGYLAGGFGEERSRKKLLWNTLFFVIGISGAFFLLGLGMTAVGQFFGRHQAAFVRIGGVIVILFALHQLGVIRFGSLERERRVHLDVGSLTMNTVTALVFGFTFSFAWTPCVGPALASVLLMASSATTMGKGLLLIGVYALGFVLPFLAVGVFADSTLGHDDHSTGCEIHDVMESLDQMDSRAGSSLDLSWNRESLVRAVVMNEILTRPSQRMIRRG